jgi:hypothetical protein
MLCQQSISPWILFTVFSFQKVFDQFGLDWIASLIQTSLLPKRVYLWWENVSVLVSMSVTLLSSTVSQHDVLGFIICFFWK